MRRVIAAASAAVLGGALLTVIAPAGPAGAATLSVPSKYRTISAAIAAAHNGDTISVSPGTYRENITIVGKRITIRSVSGPASTVIAGNPGRTPVMIQNIPAGTMTLQGFRIVSGSAPSGQGGGITIANYASPTIRNNEIASNRSNDGAGILVYNHSNPTIIGNSIHNNIAARFGGGVFAVMFSSPKITGNTITANRGYGGGGIYLENDVSRPSYRSAPSVISNTITNNVASQAGGGVMLRTGVNAVIAHNTITGNSAPYGGGIHVETTGSTPSISSNSITGNSALTSASQPGSGSGGGIAVFGHSRPAIAHNSIIGNRTTRFGGGIVLAEGSVSRLDGNNIAKNTVLDTGSGPGGGGIYLANSEATIQNNALRQNSAPLGGGVAFVGTGSLVLVNNTVVSNASRAGSAASGGGLFVSNHTSGKASVVNNIFTANNNFQIFEMGAFATYSNNLITNSGNGMFYSFPAHTITDIRNFNGNAKIRYAGGNVSGSPAFVDASAFNYRLTRGSAAIDAGRSAGAPTTDIMSVHRPQGLRPDIGAFEFIA
ncbi:right-handed parallel beta-helix repeat-containing protein [Jatrophihabitans sp.]|uniref:right-handed parallel beta-helix repeat-containing protein n=1 Tax=Jatrophihabitans sp. TaxID=1932789 RepID=UPI002CE94CDE|nr:right-handed parallel beta-helix repeat-containing protein [Jatrophihabitans sp.]